MQVAYFRHISEYAWKHATGTFACAGSFSVKWYGFLQFIPSLEKQVFLLKWECMFKVEWSMWVAIKRSGEGLLTLRPGKPRSQVFPVSFLLLLPPVDTWLEYHGMGSFHKWRLPKLSLQMTTGGKFTLSYHPNLTLILWQLFYNAPANCLRYFLHQGEPSSIVLG